MEFLKVEVLSFYDDLRDEFKELFDRIKKKYKIDEDDTISEDDPEREERYQLYEEEVIKTLENLRNKNFKLYKDLVRLFYHDYCIIVQDEDDELYEVNQEQFLEAKSEIYDLDTLLIYLQENRDFICDLVANFLDFTETDYFSKRKILLETKDLDRYLFKIFPGHIIDKMYYTIPYTIDDLRRYFYEEDMNAVGIIISLLQNLYMVDRDNFDKLMNEMLRIYYKNSSYKKQTGICDLDNKILLSKIEKEDLSKIKADIIHSMDDLENILLELYNDTFVYDKNYKEDVNREYNKHKIKKLEE